MEDPRFTMVLPSFTNGSESCMYCLALLNIDQIDYLIKIVIFFRQLQEVQGNPHHQKVVLFLVSFTLLQARLWRLNNKNYWCFQLMARSHSLLVQKERLIWLNFLISWICFSFKWEWESSLVISASCWSRMHAELFAIVVGWRIQEKGKKDHGQRSWWVFSLLPLYLLVAMCCYHYWKVVVQISKWMSMHLLIFGNNTFRRKLLVPCCSDVCSRSG